MSFNNAAELCAFLEQHADEYGYHAKPLPKAFLEDKASVRAIVLGTDPGNYDGRTFEYVFGLELKDRSPYFRFILGNLTCVNLKLHELYVQNLCQNYFGLETSDNPAWMTVAAYWTDLLRQELDALFPADLPVFLTARQLVDSLSPAYRTVASPRFYEDCRFIGGSENGLGRTLIPLFRHRHYRLANWPDYVASIRSVFLSLGKA
jgi:hypothetical protein